MVQRLYDWGGGAVLEEHSRRKHKILREYIHDYLYVRCRARRSRFRFAIVDGFAGGGRYRCGTAGSPLIFLEELVRASAAVHLDRLANGFTPLEIECRLVLNDASPDAVQALKENVAPLLAEIAELHPLLTIKPVFLQKPFELVYPEIKAALTQDRFRSVIFNLDQCGHSQVDKRTIIDMMAAFRSVEIFYTFSIKSLIAFLQKANPALITRQVQRLDIDPSLFANLDGGLSKQSWLGAAERIVFESFRPCAGYVSPFSINNPEGWRYWLIHFANAYRARQVYNNILHSNSSMQAHFGRSGLDMLSYDPRDEDGRLYLFDTAGRERAVSQLLDDIPRLVSGSGHAVDMTDFYEGIYNLTPAHSDDIHKAIIENPDLEVFTPSGGRRRMANKISAKDMLKLKPQRSFHHVLGLTSSL